MRSPAWHSNLPKTRRRAQLRLQRSNLVWSPRAVRAALRLDGHHGICVPLACNSYVRMEVPTMQRTVRRMAPQVHDVFLPELRLASPHLRHDSAVETHLDKAVLDRLGPIFAIYWSASTKRRRRLAELLRQWRVRLDRRPSPSCRPSARACPSRPRASSRRAWAAQKLCNFAEDDDIRDMPTASPKKPRPRSPTRSRSTNAFERPKPEFKPSMIASNATKVQSNEHSGASTRPTTSSPSRKSPQPPSRPSLLCALFAFLDVRDHVTCVGSGTSVSTSDYVGRCEIPALHRSRVETPGTVLPAFRKVVLTKLSQLA